MEDAILDESLFIEKQNIQLLEAVSWWEKKRLWYNLIIGIVGVSAGILFMEEKFFRELIIIEIIAYAILVNACYTASWVCETLFFYYIYKAFPFAKFRMILFISGTLFSMIMTLSLTALVSAFNQM